MNMFDPLTDMEAQALSHCRNGVAVYAPQLYRTLRGLHERRPELLTLCPGGAIDKHGNRPLGYARATHEGQNLLARRRPSQTAASMASKIFTEGGPAALSTKAETALSRLRELKRKNSVVPPEELAAIRESMIGKSSQVSWGIRPSKGNTSRISAT